MKKLYVVLALFILFSRAYAASHEHEWGNLKTECGWDCDDPEMSASSCRESGNAHWHLLVYRECKKCDARKIITRSSGHGTCADAPSA